MIRVSISLVLGVHLHLPNRSVDIGEFEDVFPNRDKYVLVPDIRANTAEELIEKFPHVLTHMEAMEALIQEGIL